MQDRYTRATNVTLEQAIQLGMKHHTAGQLREAEAVYRNILQHVPDHPDALHLLGLVAQQVGRSDAAIELMTQAIAGNPNVALYHSNLAEAYRTRGMLADAEKAARRALELDPT